MRVNRSFLIVNKRLGKGAAIDLHRDVHVDVDMGVGMGVYGVDPADLYKAVLSSCPSCGVVR